MSERTEMQVVAMSGTVIGEPKWKEYGSMGYASFDVKNTPYVPNCKRDTTSIFHVAFWGKSGEKAMEFLKDGLFLSFEGKMTIGSDHEPVIHIYSVTLCAQSGNIATLIKKTIQQSIREEIGEPTEAPVAFNGPTLIGD